MMCVLFTRGSKLYDTIKVTTNRKEEVCWVLFNSPSITGHNTTTAAKAKCAESRRSTWYNNQL
jgi:hypothetical protein